MEHFKAMTLLMKCSSAKHTTATTLAALTTDQKDTSSEEAMHRRFLLIAFSSTQLQYQVEACYPS
jgi:hypothetical protein